MYNSLQELEIAIEEVNGKKAKKRRFSSEFDELYFVVQRKEGYDWNEKWVDVSMPYRRKADVTKKLFALWEKAQEGHGRWLDGDGCSMYSVAIYDYYEPGDDCNIVGAISATIWAQIVSGFGKNIG